jgi:Tol biopolymer transport system component
LPQVHNVIQIMDAGRVRTQLDRILASAAFADADRARSFLRFVVLRALSGRAGEIKESVIAVEALGRSPSFDPKSDPIVRVEARRLRDRLDSFYRREGQDDPIVISLPKGGYVPEFSEHQPATVPPKKKSSVRSQAGWTLFGLAVLALAWLYFHRAPESIGTFRLSILPPENAWFESFAVSPDGRTVAFTAAWKGSTVLWVRALDSTEAKPLAGTDSALYPFWSPDSRSIGFFTTSKLKTIGVTGGPTRDIADTVVGRGGSWGRDGVIVFGPKPGGVLYQVSANGGTPQPVTSLDRSREENSHALPQFLPDGRRFLYLAASARPGASAIRVGSLDGRNSKVLLGADGGAAYAPASGARPGSLLFVLGGALMVQPFDVRNLVLTGEKKVVAPEVRYLRWREPGFSVSGNGVLIYQAGTTENRRFTWFDRQGNLLETVGPHNNFAGFNLSPDERHLALWSDDDPATSSTTIWLMDLSRDGAVSRFSELGITGAEFLPVWSPDGRELLFSRGDERRMRLLRQSLHGGPVQTILDSDGPKFATDWSSDGQFLAFNTQWPDYHDMHTWTMRLDGGSAPQALSQHAFEELSTYFSPSARAKGPRWIAYTSAETGRYEVYVRDFPSGALRWTASTKGGWSPHWRSDGRELFYLTLEGILTAVPVHTGSTLELGAPQALFATELRPTPIQLLMNQYAVSQDGRRVLLNARIAEGSAATITAVVGW